MLWVLNAGKSVEGGVEGLVGSGESGRAKWQQSGYGVLSCFRDGCNDSFRVRRTGMVRTSKRACLSSKWTPWLRAIKDIDLVRFFLLDLGSG